MGAPSLLPEDQSKVRASRSILGPSPPPTAGLEGKEHGPLAPLLCGLGQVTCPL